LRATQISSLGQRRAHSIETKSKRGCVPWAQLDEPLDHEPVTVQELDPVPVCQVKLDHTVGVLPHRAREVVAHEPIARTLSALRRAGHEKGAVRHVDEPSPRPEEAISLSQPAVRLAPEARPVLGDRQIEAVGVVRHVLGTRMDQRERHSELLLEPCRDVELYARDVDGNRTEARSRDPRGDRCRTAAELDDVRSCGQVFQEPELRLGDAPDSPLELLLRPGLASGRGVVEGPAIPRSAVLLDVVGRNRADGDGAARTGLVVAIGGTRSSGFQAGRHGSENTLARASPVRGRSERAVVAGDRS